MAGEIAWQLQLVMLGALLADKRLRGKVDPADFGDVEMQMAVGELIHNSSEYTRLSKLLETCGVHWTKQHGPPLESLLARLKLDGEFARTMQLVTDALHGLTDSTDARQRFVDRIKGAADELEHGPKPESLKATEYRVTRGMLNAGVRGSERKNPITLAIQQVVPKAKVDVCLDVITVNGVGYRTPKAVQEFLAAWDSERPVGQIQEFGFSLEEMP